MTSQSLATYAPPPELDRETLTRVFTHVRETGLPLRAATSLEGVLYDRVRKLLVDGDRLRYGHAVCRGDAESYRELARWASEHFERARAEFEGRLQAVLLRRASAGDPVALTQLARRAGLDVDNVNKEATPEASKAVEIVPAVLDTRSEKLRGEVGALLDAGAITAERAIDLLLNRPSRVDS